jgi:5-methylcytosine-specific restriction endonuclease McrA
MPIKYCKKCGCDTERNNKGACRVCTAASISLWRVRNKEHIKTYEKQYNTVNKSTRAEKKKVFRQEHKEEIRAYRLRYRAENREKVTAQEKAFYQANLERMRAKNRRYSIVNAERISERNKGYYYADIEKARARVRRYAAEHPEEVRATLTKWRRENPEIPREHNANRRAKKAKNGGRLTKGLIKRLYEAQKGLCACCGGALGERSNYHLDHQMPVALGGKSEDSNMQLLLKRCNLQKGKSHPDDFAVRRGLDLI